jgi:hypothetical protein
MSPVDSELLSLVASLLVLAILFIWVFRMPGSDLEVSSELLWLGILMRACLTLSLVYAFFGWAQSELPQPVPSNFHKAREVIRWPLGALYMAALVFGGRWMLFPAAGIPAKPVSRRHADIPPASAASSTEEVTATARECALLGWALVEGKAGSWKAASWWSEVEGFPELEGMPALHAETIAANSSRELLSKVRSKARAVLDASERRAQASWPS